MVSKTGLKIAGIVVGFAAFVFAIVAVCTNHWRTGDGSSLGLWRKCDADTCSDVQVGQNPAYFAFEIVRGFGVLAVCMVFGGIMFGILSLVVKKINVGYSALATFFLMGAFFSLVSAAVFTSLDHEAQTNYGYSFILSWIAFPLALGAGILMITTSAD